MSTTSAVISASEVTPEQIAKSSQFLNATRDALVDSTTGLSKTQWEFHSAPDRWSIAEIVEHVTLVEDAILGIVKAIGDAPEAPAEWEPLQMDEFIVMEVPKRSRRVPTPPHLIPAGEQSGAEFIARFLASRERINQMIYGHSLRGRVVAHPVLGLWDGYQWLLAAAAHSARHTGLIREVKAHPDFPTATSVCFTMR